MSDIIDLAERLGKSIANSPQATTLHEARQAVSTEADLSATLQEFQTQAEKIARLEAEQKPVEVDDKHKLNELQSTLASSDTFKKYTAAQVEYVDLMRRVNEAIGKQMGDAE